MFMIVEVMTETINNEIVLALTLVCAGTNSQKPANSPYYHAAISGDDSDAGVDVNGDRHGGVIVVEQGWVCQPFDDPFHFSFLLLTPFELGSLLGERPQVLGVLQEHAGE